MRAARRACSTRSSAAPWSSARPPGRYRLGLHLVALADGVLARLDVRELARPLLRRLVSDTGESATLSVPAGNEAVTVDFVPSEASVVSMARLGPPEQRPRDVGRQGDARLRRLRRARSRALARSSARATPRRRSSSPTPSPPRSPRRVGADGRRRVGERDPDLSGVAVPVLGRVRRARVAIPGCPGPGRRGSARSGLQACSSHCAARRRDLSHALGGAGPAATAEPAPPAREPSSDAAAEAAAATNPAEELDTAAAVLPASWASHCTPARDAIRHARSPR
jgi:DNA-binding IclR family transcriptional regulator